MDGWMDTCKHTEHNTIRQRLKQKRRRQYHTILNEEDKTNGFSWEPPPFTVLIISKRISSFPMLIISSWPFEEDAYSIWSYDCGGSYYCYYLRWEKPGDSISWLSELQPLIEELLVAGLAGYTYMFSRVAPQHPLFGETIDSVLWWS